jgi:hypothetical protein
MVAVPLPVQVAYERYINVGQAGMPASASGWDVDTKICQSASIGFGLAVSQGSIDRGALLGAGTTQVIGISCHDVTLPAIDGPDAYILGDNMGVAVRGDWWVPIVAGDSPDVIPGDTVYCDNTTGNLGSAGGGGKTKIDNARWMTSVINGIVPGTGVGISLAVVRLGVSTGNSE